MQKPREDFQEIGHCGGQYTIEVKTAENGSRSIQFGITHSRPTAASWFEIYALPQGIPVATVHMGGLMGGSGETESPYSPTEYYRIFIASDKLGMFGHQCPMCNKYWRSKGVPALWRITCPYCGFRTNTHGFLTIGQLKYVKACCARIDEAIYSEDDGKHTIDMDEVADAAGKDLKKPELYYAEESQQTAYNCPACGDSNDILGRYGYCSCCGTYNGVLELEKDINNIQDVIKSGQAYEACVKGAVAAFDSYARQIAKQLRTRIPMTSKRRKEWNKRLFHNLKLCAEDLNTTFDIDMFKGLEQSDIKFAILMFHRRHVYEHNGGEADEKYIIDSGDTSVRPRQIIRETRENALRITSLVMKMSKNVQKGFHDIFPPEEKPLQMQQQRNKRKR